MQPDGTITFRISAVAVAEVGRNVSATANVRDLDETRDPNNDNNNETDRALVIGGTPESIFTNGFE